MKKLQIEEAIVVEGKYDKNALSQVVDCLILETSGFGIFKDKEKMALLRQVAKCRGLIVLTDGDGAGFVIRNRLIGSIPKSQLKHGYIPDIQGKEKRKVEKSKEGKLGVEGMTPSVLEDVLRRAGATICQESTEISQKECISTADFMEWGLTGAESEKKRGELLQFLGLPEKMSKKGLMQVLDTCYGRAEVIEILKNLEDCVEKG